MIAPFDKSVLCPVLIGRAPLIESLRQRVRQVCEGQGQTLLIAGEAGIGKSRSVQETKALAAQKGFTTLQGNCFEPDRMLPYAPLLDLVRAFVASYGEAAVALKPFAPDLVKLLPELSALLPDLVATPPLFAPARSGSTPTTTSTRPAPSAATSKAAGAAKWGRRRLTCIPK